MFMTKVKENQVISDLSLNKKNFKAELVNVIDNPKSKLNSYNIIAIMTEWDEFQNYDWKSIFKDMNKPAFVFDGRNILDIEEIKKIGFKYIGLGRK